MSKKLHIINGDSTLPILEKSGINGDVVVWRELLCEGPLHKEVGNDDFRINRYAYSQDEIGVSRIEYYDKTIKEIVRELLIWQHNDTVYGFGDLQYFQYLKKLNTYFSVKDSLYYLNELGKTVVL